ncbi:MAG: DNA primase [Paludibacteraceae bacterium]|nr:DNA primase [Paludibacteraceae bacterium]
MIPRETVDKVFSAAKIEEVVGDYVTLRKRGANMIGLCPFHTEKTGSFTVSPSKGIYKCFGCGKSGHAIGFIMEIEQCGFADAVRQVAKKYHIEIEERELTKEEQQLQDDRESMFVVNEAANKWFQSQLWDTEIGQAVAMSYFRERGLREDTIRKFQLGYSPDKGNLLAKELKQQGFIDKYILNDVDTKIGTGVCGKSDDGRIYDRFRDRVIFPIHTVSGKTVAFAGRILKKKYDKDGNEKAVGKYVNSPDSIVYSKTNELYGLYFAKQAISRTDLCYLVEGQMDVLSMYQAGIENVVCSGGTALTEKQILLIKRFTSNITVLYDGDAAGIHAAIRGIDMFLEKGFNVKVVLLPDGEDPDSYARNHNASDFIEYIQSHQTDFIHFKTQLMGKESGNDLQKRSELIHDVVGSIAQIVDPITRQVYIQDTARRLHIGEDLLIREVERLRRQKREDAAKQADLKQRLEQQSTALTPEKTISHPDTNRHEQKLEENFRNLIRMLVRYGDKPLFVQEDKTITTGEYIVSQLDGDQIVPTNTLFVQILDEYRQHSQEEGFVAERFYKFHPDIAISQFAVELIADNYQLSKLFAKQSISENVQIDNAQVGEEAHLQEIIPQLLLELKLSIVNLRINEVTQQLSSAPVEAQFDLLNLQNRLFSYKSQICQLLGDRVITI